MAHRRGLEPLASAVTGRRYNQLNYRCISWLQGTDSHRRSSGYEPDELLLLHPAIYLMEGTLANNEILGVLQESGLLFATRILGSSSVYH